MPNNLAADAPVLTITKQRAVELARMAGIPAEGMFYGHDNLHEFAMQVIGYCFSQQDAAIVQAEPTPQIMADACVATWGTPSMTDLAKGNSAVDIVLQVMRPNEGVTRAEMAAVIATMAPAYRAMIMAGKMQPGQIKRTMN